MKAIVPLHLAALRVSPADASNIVPQFKGRVAAFDRMPYRREDTRSSTGDTIIQPLEVDDSPLDTLCAGIHLHWELPDYFRKGVQAPDSPRIVFPQVPEKWLVVRYLSLLDRERNEWTAPTSHSWLVESDCILTERQRDADGRERLSVPVPLPLKPVAGDKPYRYMGRVTDLEQGPEDRGENLYLRDFTDGEGRPCYLTSIGFFGPSFASSYPECCSIFGFCDRFLDNEVIYSALRDQTPVCFKVGYQVMGWTEGADPLDGIQEKVKDMYNEYIETYSGQQSGNYKSPSDFFVEYAEQTFGWRFSEDQITFRLRADGKVDELIAPEKTICSGILQEIIWDMTGDVLAEGFLRNTESPQFPAIWTDDDLRIAVGNNSVEALSALLKGEQQNGRAEHTEFLLNSLQLGSLSGIENEKDIATVLEEAIHAFGFSRESGGFLWIVRRKGDPDEAVDATQEIDLPLPLARSLYELNRSQKEYDTARQALLVMRSQLFMDWYRYIKMYTEKVGTEHVDISRLSAFLTTSSGSELVDVVRKEEETGKLVYLSKEDDSQVVVGVKEPEEDTLAYRVWEIYAAFMTDLQEHPDWEMLALAAPVFHSPMEPVTVMEGKRLGYASRNGRYKPLPVRTSSELFAGLRFDTGETVFDVLGKEVIHPFVKEKFYYTEELNILLEEAALLIPLWASCIADALSAQGGKGNPAITDYRQFVKNLQTLQGGINPKEGGDRIKGLFERVREDGYVPEKNPVLSLEGDSGLKVTFTNGTFLGALPPHVIAWNKQVQDVSLSETRYDPFLPVNLVWEVAFEPLQKSGGSRKYAPDVLTECFRLNDTATDYEYEKASFTSDAVTYRGSALMSEKTPGNWGATIRKYAAEYLNEEERLYAGRVAGEGEEREIFTQTLNGWDSMNILRNYIPAIPVQDLTLGERDRVTAAVCEAAMSDGGENGNWYWYGFTGEAPIAAGPQALGNFGPLRSGFLSIRELEVVDVFGQRMRLKTKHLNQDGSLEVIPAFTLAPSVEDQRNQGKVYFPPRLLVPTRLWFRFIHPEADFVEMNIHPATTPACGWIMPNYLDASIFFYDPEGNAIGSFGIEHGELKYRTYVGNMTNTSDSLSADIGEKGQPKVNAHLAAFMWYIAEKSKEEKTAFFLRDLMSAMFYSQQYISPDNNPRDGSLAILMGRPLALVRVVVGLESQGRLLPLDQADMTREDPWPQDILANRYVYRERMEYSSAGLGRVNIPLHLGRVNGTDDGLIGFLKEQEGEEPYGTTDFYAPAAEGGHGVEPLADTTLCLSVNADPQVLTMLIDPRAEVHATTGLFPENSLAMSPDQYTDAIGKLQMTFLMHPLLCPVGGVKLPLPEESGFQWLWIGPGNQPGVLLNPGLVNGNALWGYSPQVIKEGWIKLEADSTDN